jgi:phosphatidylinositol alpha-1,6-mannosyltransferase
MKILTFLHDAFGSLGGIARNNRDVIDGLVNDARVTRVVAIPRILGSAEEALPAKLDWRRQAGRGLGAYLRASLRAMMDGRPDLVLCLHIRLLPVAWLASLLTGAPLWVMIFGIDAWDRPGNPLLVWLVRRAQRVISISDVTTARFQSWAHVAPGRLRLLPCIVDLDRFRPGPANPDLAARYSISGKRVLFTFGRLVSAERAKGMDEVMEAMPGLLADHPDLVYLIGGGGPDRPRLEAKATSLGLGDRVIFAGRIAEEEKVAHYHLADAYVMPSRGEGFGIVILEALACGVPALASSKDGGREALLDGKLGLLVDPDDRASVASGIRAVLARPRGRPAGLEYYSVGENRVRVSRLLDEIARPAGKAVAS